MQEGQDFLEYLELQDNLDMLTKSELLEHVRRTGGPISDRTLTFYVTEGLVPKSARVGSRGGAYPKVVGELVAWIVRSRARGLSVEALKELLPLWKFLQRAVRAEEVSLAEFEYVARQHVRSPEALFAVPSLFSDCMPCLACLSKTDFLLKDGQRVRHSEETPLTLGFALATEDPESGEVRRLSDLLVSPPLQRDIADNPSTVVVGIPNGRRLPPRSEGPVEAPVPRG